MGCYMSTPDNKVYITEGDGKRFTYATASCQGWRREQEDAEACLPFFDVNTSLFILCDGHGGAEVAKYTVEHFPDFLKNHQLYKEGKYAEALAESFVDFDKHLRSETVMAELQKMSTEIDDKDNTDTDKEGKSIDHLGKSNEDECQAPTGSTSSAEGPGPSSHNGANSVVEDVDVDILRKEAQVPIRELIDKYSSAPAIDKSKRQGLLTKYNASPVVRPKKEESDEMEPSSSKDQGDLPGPSTSKSDDFSPEAIKESILNEVFSASFPDDDSSDDSEYEGSDDDEDDDDDDDDDDDGDDEEDGEATTTLHKKLRHKKHKRPSVEITDSSSEDDNSDELEDSDEEQEDEDDEDEDQEEDSDEDEEDSGQDMDYIEKWEDMIASSANRQHTPGMDSGCTVVVALLKDDKLYVASAGDSRCIIVMRNEECKPMSFDHKPEDKVECERIMKAGGRVAEGRVNGGLNLSRAFGDFTYKNPELPAKDQMITPCPDVKVADLDFDKVGYIFLACDGIWNSVKNNFTAKFICKTAPIVDHDLGKICVNLFQACIAPRTDGDGTGCDNMTCIIAKLRSSTEKEGDQENIANNNDLKTKQEENDEKVGSSSSDIACKTSQKRSSSEEAYEASVKRRCVSISYLD